MTVERPLHTAIRYGISQALLGAVALARRGGDLQYVYDRDGGGPFFVMQQISIEVAERASYVGSGEFA